MELWITGEELRRFRDAQPAHVTLTFHVIGNAIEKGEEGNVYLRLALADGEVEGAVAVQNVQIIEEEKE